MRWDRLFADLEGQAEDLALTERDALAAELHDEEWAQTSWLTRLGGAVTLDLLGAGRVAGETVLVNERLLHLRSTSLDHVVAVDAVLAVVESGGRTEPAGRVERALGWGHVLRAAREDGDDLRIVRRDGLVSEGRADVVGRDFLTVLAGSGRSAMVPFGALAVVSLRR